MSRFRSNTIQCKFCDTALSLRRADILAERRELPSMAIENTRESTHALPASYLLDGPDDGMSRANRRSSVRRIQISRPEGRMAPRRGAERQIPWCPIRSAQARRTRAGGAADARISGD